MQVNTTNAPACEHQHGGALVRDFRAAFFMHILEDAAEAELSVGNAFTKQKGLRGGRGGKWSDGHVSVRKRHDMELG